LKENVIRSSRRRFLTVGSLGLIGLWAGCSDELGARTVRRLVAETSRRVLPAELTPTPQYWNSQDITAAWLGHSTVLLNFYGVNILTDPALGRRVGADTLFGTIGAKRLIAPALLARQLPPIDLVLLSHAHMDHLDPATLRALPGRPRAVTARNTLDLLRDTRLNEPRELAWGERTRISTLNGEVDIAAFEVKHWGARWRVDTHRGYNGYTITREGRSLLFGGDTAWCGSFRGLRRQGPFEMAIMPIGAYQPWIGAHCTPEQAVRMANDAGARFVLPIHFKTFPLGREGSIEPMERLEGAVEAERIAWRQVGQTFRVA
jgi:L-ascorbate metabolism protein UlaG (beta-lactamase superfamily)